MEINVIPAEFNAPPKEVFPFPSPFILSSMERDWCMRDPERVTYIKSRHLEENLKVIAPQIGMSAVQQANFLEWWCAHADGSTEIRAESDPYFNLRQRAIRWKEKHPDANGPARKSRLQQYTEKTQRLNALINELYSDTDAATAAGPADGPDEQ